MFPCFHFLRPWSGSVLPCWIILYIKRLHFSLCFFRKHCLLCYFHICRLAHPHFRLIVGNITTYSGDLSTLVGLFRFLNDYDILNLNVTVHPEWHKDTIYTSECFIFGEICGCHSMLGSIGRSKSPSIVDFVFYTWGHFSLIVFVFGLTLFRWQILPWNFLCILNQWWRNFPLLLIVYFLYLALERYCYIYVHYQFRWKIYHYSIIKYFSDHPPHLFFILSCSPVIPPLGCIVLLHSCG